MGMAVELISAQDTQVAASLTSLPATSGDSLQVRAFDPVKKARLLQAWVDSQTAGTAQIRSAGLHDNVRGIRLDVALNQPWPLLPWGVSQQLRTNDTLIIELLSGNVIGDIDSIALLLLYDDLAGVSPRFITVDDLMRRGVNISGVENTLSLGTTEGYSGAEAINAENDQFHAGVDYALVGGIVDTECTLVGYRGTDTSNLRVGFPGAEDLRWITADWFIRLSKAFNLPLIPVIRAENKAGTQIDGLQDENGADTTVISHFVELAK